MPWTSLVFLSKLETFFFSLKEFVFLSRYVGIKEASTDQRVRFQTTGFNFFFCLLDGALCFRISGVHHPRTIKEWRQEMKPLGLVVPLWFAVLSESHQYTCLFSFCSINNEWLYFLPMADPKLVTFLIHSYIY